ncbi:MAG: hypothetical protein ABIY47_04415 [Opitutaceae bacterium]
MKARMGLAKDAKETKHAFDSFAPFARQTLIDWFTAFIERASSRTFFALGLCMRGWQDNENTPSSIGSFVSFCPKTKKDGARLGSVLGSELCLAGAMNGF